MLLAHNVFDVGNGAHVAPLFLLSITALYEAHLFIQ